MFVSDKGCMPPSHLASFYLVWSAVDLIFRLSAQSATLLVFASMVISNSYPIILNEVIRLKCQILPGALLPLFFCLAKVFLVVMFGL